DRRGALRLEPLCRGCRKVCCGRPPSAGGDGRKPVTGSMRTGTYEYKSDFARKYFSAGEARGEAKGEARALLLVLRARGIPVSAEVEARVMGCTDLGRLSAWVERAPFVETAEELF